jgi:ABC-type sulfate transport system permease subunit
LEENMTVERRRAILGILLAVEGALIIAGAIVVAFSVSALYPLDQLLGADASIAAVVLGGAFIMSFRNPTRSWVNLGILYSALTIAVQLWKYTTAYGTRPSILTMVVSAIFLVGFLALYPRHEAVGTTAVPA